MGNNIIDVFEKYRVIPVVVIEDADFALGLADALLEGGLPVAEITFRTKAAGQTISILNDKRPELTLGAGTVLTLDNLKAAKDCGAKFAVAPGLNPNIVSKAQELKLDFYPGIATPTDIEQALVLGCKILKFFPAEACGGVKFLKAISGPYKHTGIKFIPTGGINADNLAGYLQLPSVPACGGSWIAKKDEISNKNWSQISEKCRAIADIIKRISS
ncbi:MAG: bifunctional 4-hydroxy-2-oxoglutarate aldolase/2-dehydro-3-deoxy-phosphogluconate aldolase [Sedimentisphaerales bacterium]|nr:bifunctional 4-hydroxy-2-oxoglutarate aldolase/2-dehydro-3-deoxy-phosphogluconate aldolase [Sedimentisphaerales bacterium]